MKKKWLCFALTLWYWLFTMMPIHAYQKPEVNLYSDAMILYDRITSTVIAEQNSDARMYPASLTKLLTAVVVLEAVDDYDATVTITSQMLAGLAAANASVAGYVSGETLTIRQLLYGLLLPSGADAANALSIYVAGSIDAFVERMNETASRIGMASSHFMNPTGLDHENQYTTARDMLRLLDYAMEFDVFLEIASTSKFTFITNKHPAGITLTSSLMPGKDPKSAYYSPYLTGGKTGYTGWAGRCLASFSINDGKEYILITLHAPFEGYIKPSKSFADAKELYGWAYDHLYHAVYARQDEVITTVPLHQSWKRTMDIHWPEDAVILLDRYDMQEPVLELILEDLYAAPIKTGDLLGSALIKYDNEIIYEANLYASTDIKYSYMVSAAEAVIGFIRNHPLIFMAGVICVILICVLNIIIKRNRYRRRHRK